MIKNLKQLAGNFYRRLWLTGGGMIVLLMIGLGGCYYDVHEELYPNGISCDTSNVGYAKDVQPILESSCYTCHSAAAGLGGIILEGYSNVKIVADDGRLKGALNHESGFSPMPKDAPQLSECNLAKINKWIDDGALNN